MLIGTQVVDPRLPAPLTRTVSPPSRSFRVLADEVYQINATRMGVNGELDRGRFISTVAVGSRSPRRTHSRDTGEGWGRAQVHHGDVRVDRAQRPAVEQFSRNERRGDSAEGDLVAASRSAVKAPGWGAGSLIQRPSTYQTVVVVQLGDDAGPQADCGLPAA